MLVLLHVSGGWALGIYVLGVLERCELFIEDFGLSGLILDIFRCLCSVTSCWRVSLGTTQSITDRLGRGLLRSDILLCEKAIEIVQNSFFLFLFVTRAQGRSPRTTSLWHLRNIVWSVSTELNPLGLSGNRPTSLTLPLLVIKFV